MHLARTRAFLLIAFLFLLLGNSAAQSYTSIVVFGDSLSDTGNLAAYTRARYTVNGQVPGPATGYTDGRFTDGLDTSPAARNYIGVWVEQLAAKLPGHPVIKYSGGGGTDYAWGSATTANGTTSTGYGPGNILSVTVDNMGQQVANYLATKPTITANTLFVLWGGANDLLAATSTADVTAAADREAALAQLLINAGATQILVVTLPPLGLVPRLNASSSTAVPATSASLFFNAQVLGGIGKILQAALTGNNLALRIYLLDTYQLFNAVIASPTSYGFANVTAKAQGNTAINPDTYLFWDDLHPTTSGHGLLANVAFNVLGAGIPTTTSIASSKPGANLNDSVTFTATVTAAASATSGIPIGLVAFYDGSTGIGISALSGSGTTATATFTTSTLTAGPHTISAIYEGIDGYQLSQSPTLTQTVTAPALVVSRSPTALTIPRGTSGSTTLTLSSVGGYTGTAAIACAALPSPDFTCTVATPSVTIASGATVSTNVTLNTRLSAALQRPSVFHDSGTAPLLAAIFGLPLLAGAGFLRRRPGLLLFALFTVATLGISGCAGTDPNANSVPVGSYQVQITITPSTGLAISVPLTVTVQ